MGSGQGTVTADSMWRPVALFTRQNENLCALFTRQYFSVVADRPPSPILKITFDASKVALLGGRTIPAITSVFCVSPASHQSLPRKKSFADHQHKLITTKAPRKNQWEDLHRRSLGKITAADHHLVQFTNSTSKSTRKNHGADHQSSLTLARK
jgi:hypothetical protein